jgi:type VI secretion system secreted protein Hcp
VVNPDDAARRNEARVRSYVWRVVTPKHFPSTEASGEQFSNYELEVLMPTSNASPKLMEACATGVQFKKAILACRNSAEEDREFVRITLSDPVITSYESSCDSVDQESPIDRITIEYSKIELEYRERKPDGLGGVFKGAHVRHSKRKVR